MLIDTSQESPLVIESDSRTLLEKALNANAWFSRISGIALAVLSPWLAEFAGIDTWVVLIVGLGLIAYSLWLGSAASRRPIVRSEALTAIVGDDLWVMAAAAIIFFTDWITTDAKIVLGVLSAIVAAFGVVQLIGLAQQEKADLL